jgi:hypothetical protein
LFISTRKKPHLSSQGEERDDRAMFGGTRADS